MMPETRQDEIVGGNGKSLGIASLVLGVLALICSVTGIGALIGLICGIVGLILGAKARRILPPQENGLATAGWICSIISLCLCGAVLLMVFGLLGMLGLAAL